MQAFILSGVGVLGCDAFSTPFSFFTNLQVIFNDDSYCYGVILRFDKDLPWSRIIGLCNSFAFLHCRASKNINVKINVVPSNYTASLSGNFLNDT